MANVFHKRTTKTVPNDAVITGDPSRIAEIGFSYNIVPVPEPVGCLALLPVALLFLKRRRPQVSVSLRVAAV